MKKKLLSMLIAGCLTLVTTSAFAAADKLVIDGEVLSIPTEMGTIKEVDNRTLVPVRYVAEYLGYTVNYSDSNVVNGETVESAIVTSSTGTTYLIMDNSLVFYVLPGPEESVGGPITMDTPSYIDDADNRFYIPVRFLAEAMGYDVAWDEENQTVSMIKK